MLDNISVFHSSIRIVGSKTIYFDPYKVEENHNDADVIFVTHEHFDHYSPEDIDKVIKDDTIIVAPQSMASKLDYENVLLVDPEKEYEVCGIKFSTVWSYNVGKPFHPKKNCWVGYLVSLDDTIYYVAGDTDVTEEAKAVKCDVAMLPCGGFYTMNVKEAASLANIIKPKIAVPTHYGSVAGSKEDGDEFVSLLEDGIQGVVKIGDGSKF